jgi:citrate synthase
MNPGCREKAARSFPGQDGSAFRGLDLLDDTCAAVTTIECLGYKEICCNWSKTGVAACRMVSPRPPLFDRRVGWDALKSAGIDPGFARCAWLIFCGPAIGRKRRRIHRMGARNAMSTAVAGKGLEGIVAANSGICWIDGEAGVLAYRGIDIHELAEKSTFEETTFLLWNGYLPNQLALREFESQLALSREIDQRIVDMLRGFPRSATPMEVLRTAVSALSFYDADEQDNSHDANVRKSYRLTSQMAMIVAIYDRIRKGLEIVPPDRALTHAANFLWMLNGVKPSETATRTLDVALILHADHELNASTFAARVIAATLSDVHSAITGAIGALKGPLHGGANEAVMRLLYAVDSAGADPVEYVKDMLTAKQKVPGCGHRVYKTEDPRATHLRRMSEQLGKDAGQTKWFEMSRAIEIYMKSAKKLNANVDFYSASTYKILGIDIDLYTPIFAVSRIAGWTAHVIEQLDDNRLIRPRAEYIGPAYPSHWVPIKERV